MALSPGARVGGFDILARIGAGGTGEVYRARDTRLGRDVALKVLPGTFAADPDRVRRFEREAQVLASLNHPNIAAIYGVEQADDIAALVLELVEGPTLADRLRQGPLPVDEALAVARQICAALAAAHDHGIVHRDLKPANITLRPDGSVKVLDFGLAKAVDPGLGHSDQGSGDLANSPTITSPGMTRAGMILGTAAYMSPEQARGVPVDRRADLWAFGCVLFEMLAGRPAFEGATVADVLAAVMAAKPDWTRLPPDTPAPVRRVLERCLKKDATARLRDAADAALDLDDRVAEDDRARADFVRRSPLIPRLALGGTGLVLAVAAFLIGFSWRTAAPVERPVMHLTLSVPYRLADSRIAMSPDGSRIAYAAVGPAGRRLFVQKLDDDNPRIIADLPEPLEPFFSPDGSWIGVFAQGQLRRINVESGLSEVVCEVRAQTGGGSWTPDGTHIVYAVGGRLLRVAASGGQPEVIVSMDRRGLRFPHVLPGGRSLLYAAFDTERGTAVEIVAHDLQTGRREILGAGEDAQYLPTGHLAFVRGGVLLVAPFDLETMKLTGAPFPVVQPVAQTTGGGALFAVSSASRLVYARSQTGPMRRLVSVDRRGSITPLAVPPRTIQQPRVSPDGTKILFEDLDVPHSVWTFDVASGALTRLVTPGASHNPIWSWDGSRIVYQATADEDTFASLYWRAADGSRNEERLLTAEQGKLVAGSLTALSWTPDGRFLAWSELGQPNRKIWIRQMFPAGQPEPLSNTTGNEPMAAFSPDGRWLAYVTNASGRYEVYVRSFPERGGVWQVSNAGGSHPVWARSGRELFYVNGDELLAVDITPGRAFVAGRPRVLFKTRVVHREGSAEYDVFPDGQRFVIVEETDSAAPAQFHVVVEWFEELKRVIPAGPK